MNQETRNCQNCKKDFVIESDDFTFYEKMKVPVPTFCPECRLIRRMSWRNERALTRHSCGLCGKQVITIYPEASSFPIYCRECWWSDKWDSMKYEQEYDFKKPFFTQFAELLNRVPKVNFFGQNNVNCDYSTNVWDDKNCYLCTSTLKSEDICYSRGVDKSYWCADCLHIADGNHAYECIDSNNINSSSFLIDSADCVNCHFLFDCRNCSDCFMSTNLRNKRFVFRNIQYTEQEFKKLIAEENISKHSSLEKLLEEFKLLRQNAIHKYAQIVKSPNCTGNSISNSHNVKGGYYISSDAEDSKYCYRGHHFKDVYDAIFVVEAELTYESANVGFGVARSMLSLNLSYSINDVQYCESCYSSSNLFGCFGLRDKHYCILNKQYTKEEYEELVPRIIAHMNEMTYTDKKGRTYKYGEFFPIELSLFAYNETLAQEYYPLTKEEALAKGYKWKEPDNKSYIATMSSDSLPDDIKDVPDSIVNEVIPCAHKDKGCNEMCTTAFKIIPQELALYRQMGIPLPRLCPNCRHFSRLKKTNPLKLWHRKCMKPGCQNEFETPYAPERPEIVYCEQCYNAEVA